MKLIMLFVFMVSVFSGILYAEDITALDGTVYKDAQVLDSNPLGIDITYKNTDGTTVVKGLKFTNLPEAIQKKYGYNPNNIAGYDSVVKKYQGQSLQDIVQKQQQQIVEFKKALAGKTGEYDIDLKHKDYDELLFSRRNAVTVKAVSATSQGMLVEIEQVHSGPPPAKQVIVDGLTIPVGSTWNGFIYPTGIKANASGQKGIPVYAEKLDNALSLLENCLNTYGDYATTTANIQSSPASSNTDTNINLNYDDSNYYIGDPYPVYWYNNNYWNRHHWHHPPQPHPGPYPHPTPRPSPRPSPQPHPIPHGGGGFRR